MVAVCSQLNRVRCSSARFGLNSRILGPLRGGSHFQGVR